MRCIFNFLPTLPRRGGRIHRKVARLLESACSSGWFLSNLRQDLLFLLLWRVFHLVIVNCDRRLLVAFSHLSLEVFLRRLNVGYHMWRWPTRRNSRRWYVGSDSWLLELSLYDNFLWWCRNFRRGDRGLYKMYHRLLLLKFVTTWRSCNYLLVWVVDFFICTVENVWYHFSINLINLILYLFDKFCPIPNHGSVSDYLHFSL